MEDSLEMSADALVAARAGAAGRSGREGSILSDSRSSTSANSIAMDTTTGYEVYVMLRPFKAFGERTLKYLAPSGAKTFRDVMKRVGICHYVIAFREVGSDKGYLAFDFGPMGGTDRDVCVSNKEEGLVPVGQGGSKAVRGEVREAKIEELAKDHLKVGTTSLTLDEIRTLCEDFPSSYELHVNDCRHFVNAVAEAATGVRRASLVVGRDSMKRESLLKCWSPWEVGMILTDYQNFPWVQRYSKTFTTVMAAITGGKIGWSLCRPTASLGIGGFLGQVPAQLGQVCPQLVKSGGKLVVDKPLRGSAITATYATALATFNESHLFREGVRLTKDLGDGIKAVALAMEGALVSPLADLGGASQSAIVALGGVGGTLRNKTLEYAVSRPLAQMQLHCPNLSRVVLRLVPRPSAAEVAVGNRVAGGGTITGALKCLHRVLPSMKMNKALQGRAMRLARPAYQIAVGANANV